MKKAKLIIIIMLFTNYLTAQTDEFRRHLVRAETAIKMDLYKEAIAEYQAAISVYAEDPGVYYNLAVVQEKIGTYDMFKQAIVNYKQYIKLSPTAADKEDVTNKIYAIEFKLDKLSKTSEELSMLGGTWRSNIYVENNGKPFWVFDFQVVDTELRITVSERSALYKSDFTYKTVTIPLDSKNINFIYTNDFTKKAENNDVSHSLVDVIGSRSASSSALSPLLHGLLDATAEKGYQSICTYVFKLRQEGDVVSGTLQVIERKMDGTSNKIIQDNISEITFNKSNDNYPLPTKDQINDKKLKEKKSKRYDATFGYVKIGYSSTGQGLKGKGMDKGIQLDFIGFNSGFNSVSKSPVKLGLSCSDEISYIMGKKISTYTPYLLPMYFKIGPSITFLPAMDFKIAAYFNVCPGVLMAGNVDGHEIGVAESFKFIYKNTYGVNLKYSSLILGLNFDSGKLNYSADKTIKKFVDLKTSSFSIGISF